MDFDPFFGFWCLFYFFILIHFLFIIFFILIHFLICTHFFIFIIFGFWSISGILIHFWDFDPIWILIQCWIFRHFGLFVPFRFLIHFFDFCSMLIFGFIFNVHFLDFFSRSSSGDPVSLGVLHRNSGRGSAMARGSVAHRHQTQSGGVRMQNGKNWIWRSQSIDTSN